MPSGEEPLFTSGRPSSGNSEEQANEEDALLGNQRKVSQQPRRFYGTNGSWKDLGLFIWALVATVVVIVLAVLLQHQSEVAKRGDTPKKHTGKRNLIFMVSDGMGPASLSLTRSFRQFRDALPIDDTLILDKHLIGSSRTRSSSSLVTDSAAGATAFSCGLKSYNGAISMLPDHSPCGTVLEAAKKAGYMTGLVVTTSITDATPAAFASHARIRTQEDLIAEQEVGHYPLNRVLDLMVGGGACHFKPNSTKGSCRADDKDIIKMAQEQFDWTSISTRKEFDGLNADSRGGVKLPLMALFADYDIPYEIDRRNMDDVYPSLEETTRFALNVLEAATRDRDQGFFLMVEGSRIDHAGHGNDPAAQVHEVLAYDKAFGAVTEFLEKSTNQGVLVATSDHETGGLATARQLTSIYPHYLWYPEVLANASHSSSFLGRRLRSELSSRRDKSSKSLKDFINEELIKSGLGITDASDAEIQSLIDAPAIAAYTFADMISRRAEIGWSTHGHSAVDVNIYGTSGSQDLRGNNENTDVGKFLRDYLDVDVDKITEELVKNLDSARASNGVDWTGRMPTEEELQAVMDLHVL